MLYIVNSLPKCGSTWFYSYIDKCLARLGGVTAKAALEPGVPVNPWGSPGRIAGENFDQILTAARTQTFVVKTHEPPADDLKAALADGRARMIFLVRHPADILRGSLAYGEYCREYDSDEPYKNLYTPQDAVAFCEPFMKWGHEWFGVPGVTLSRYEDTFSNDEHTIETAVKLVPDAAPIAAAVLAERRVSALSQRERNHLRVNLVRRPKLNADAEAWAREWATKYGY